MKALIKVGYGCNENCTFCHTLEYRHVNGETQEIEAKIRRAKALGHSMVVLSGGEATLRPELFRWAKLVASLDMDFGLVTNGLLLAYPEVVERLLSDRLRYVYMSLHGPKKVHNSVVRADTFDAALTALKNLSGRGLDLTVNAVIVRQNVDHLRALVDEVLPFKDAVLKFSMVQPKGGGNSLFDALTPRVSYVAQKVVDAIAYGREQAGPDGLKFAHDGLPFCLLPGLEDCYDDLRTHRFATMVEIGEPDFFPVDDKAKVQPPPCHGCALRGPCPGLFAGYAERHGHHELKPPEGRARSNSFHYVFEALVPPPAEGQRCVLTRDGVTPFDRGRHLFVQHNGRVARYHTTTRDFADVELEAIKHGLGQLYVDVSKKPALDDFAKDLVQLRRSKVCDGCADRELCTGLFEPVLEDVFTRDDERVRSWVAGLEGDVLDVGCGHGPYDDVLAPLARAGTIRYVGVDPSPGAIAARAAQHPWARLLQAEGESLDAHFAPESFDHALVLRSWNHLRNPERALAALHAVLRPGGTLTVVDNVAFGVARMPAQAQRAERSSSEFEHFRNDADGQAAALLEAAGFVDPVRRGVGPGTSNQWIIRAQRRS